MLQITNLWAKSYGCFGNSVKQPCDPQWRIVDTT